MQLSKLELSGVTVRLNGSVHIGTGFGRGLIDRAVVRGRDGLVYVPGSALKGKARDACESLARLYKLGDCRAPYPAQMVALEESLLDPGQNLAHRDNCLVCRLFGAPGRSSLLTWSPAKLDEAWIRALRTGMDSKSRTIPGQTTTRTQVQLSRARGMAAEAKLFTSEFATEGLVFTATPAIEGHLQLTPVSGSEEVFYELVLLLAGLKLVQTLGGGQSRGAGQCEIILPEYISVDNREISVKDHLEHVDELEYYWIEAEAQQ